MSAKKPAPKQSLPIFWIVIGVVVVAGLIGVILASRGDDSGSAGTDSEFGTAEITGTALSVLDKTVADPAIGTAAPTVTGVNFDGDTVKLEPDGNAHMVVFLAHWCPHCNAEAPRLKDALDQGVPDGVTVDIVPTGSDELRPNWPPSRWVADMGIDSLPTLVDTKDAKISQAFGLDGYPFIVELDKDFKVIARYSGEQGEGFFPAEFQKLAATTAAE